MPTTHHDILAGHDVSLALKVGGCPCWMEETVGETVR